MSNLFNIAQVHLQLQRGAGEADQLPPGAAPPLGHIRLLHLHTVHEARPEQGLCSGLPAVWKVDMDEKKIRYIYYLYSQCGGDLFGTKRSEAF